MSDYSTKQTTAEADRRRTAVQRFEAGELSVDALRAELGIVDDFLICRTLPDGTREVVVRTDRPHRFYEQRGGGEVK